MIFCGDACHLKIDWRFDRWSCSDQSGTVQRVGICECHARNFQWSPLSIRFILSSHHDDVICRNILTMFERWNRSHTIARNPLGTLSQVVNAVVALVNQNSSFTYNSEVFNLTAVIIRGEDVQLSTGTVTSYVPAVVQNNMSSSIVINYVTIIDPLAALSSSTNVWAYNEF